MTTPDRSDEAAKETPTGGLESSKPLMIYDGECGFCTDVARRWRRRIGPGLRIAPLQDDSSRPDNLPVRQLEEAVHLVEPDGMIFRGAAAVFRALAMRRRWAWLWWMYRAVPGFGPVSEWVYDWVADHRGLVSRLTKWLRRDDPGAPG